MCEYQCLNCKLVVHKGCHVKVLTRCRLYSEEKEAWEDNICHSVYDEVSLILLYVYSDLEMLIKTYHLVWHRRWYFFTKIPPQAMYVGVLFLFLFLFYFLFLKFCNCSFLHIVITVLIYSMTSWSRINVTSWQLTSLRV